MKQNQDKIMTFTKIHETAVVSPNAQLGKDVEIGPCAVIGDNVKIGDGTKIGGHTVIDGWTDIGKNCIVHSRVSIGSEPQERKFNNKKSYVIIGDNTQIREFVIVNRATGEEKETRIGSNCLLLAYSHVANNCIVDNHVVMSNFFNTAGHFVAEERVASV